MPSHRNENDSDDKLLAENSPPLAPNAMPASAYPHIATHPATLAGSTSNDEEYGGDVTPPVYDDSIFAEGGGDMGSVPDSNDGRNETKAAPVPVDVDGGDEGPPSSGRATAGSSPPMNATAMRHSVPALASGADADASDEVAGRDDCLVCSGDQDPDRSILVEGGGDIQSECNEIQNEMQPVLVPVNIRCGLGPEIIDDKDGPLLPISMTGIDVLDTCKSPVQQKARSEIELIEDIDGPAPPSVMLALEDFDIISKKATGCIELGETGDELSPPSFDDAEFDDHDATKKKAKHFLKQPVRSGEDSLVIPIEEDMDVNVNLTNAAERGDEELPPVDSAANTNTASPNAHNTEDEEVNAEQVNNPESIPVHASVDLETGSLYHVIEAKLVEDRNEVIYDATPLDPVDPPLRWREQKQTKRFFVVVCVVILAGAIVIGVLLSSNEPAATATTAVAIVFASSNAPSVSIAPSSIPSSPPTVMARNISSTTTFPPVKPTEAPSASIKLSTPPSYGPSSTPYSPPLACASKMSSDAKKIVLPLDDPYQPKVAVDGKNMVVAVQDGIDGRHEFVIFHSLTNDGWQRVNTFRLDDLGEEYTSVAISGNTAFVGSPYANRIDGAVHVYEQNAFGNWEKMEDPFIRADDPSDYNSCTEFGWRVGIDGDLAYVRNVYHAYMFRRENNKWVEFDRILDVGMWDNFVISGDTIAVRSYDPTYHYRLHFYKYMPDLDGVISIQDPIPASVYRDYSLDLSSNYLVYWDSRENDAFIYRREGSNQTFAFHQQLNISGPMYNELVLDRDILVVQGHDNIHIFSEQNGNWEETITLDQRYDHYALSGRQLLAMTQNGVYSFDIKDCVQEMPTQTPSSSQVPSASPKTSPPTSSFSPTEECYWITIAVVYGWYPYETSWELWRVVDDSGDNQLVKSYEGLEGDDSHSDSICLQEGEWEFAISDAGIGRTQYNVTSNGALIAEEEGFLSRSTIFSIPFVPAP